MNGNHGVPAPGEAWRCRVRRLARVVVGTAIVLGIAATSGGAAVKPDASITLPLPLRDLAMTGRSVAWVQAPINPYNTLTGVDVCGQAGLWVAGSSRRWQFGHVNADCTQGASTGEGFWDISVATRRLLWIEYQGGNFRDWYLVTASTTKRRPVVLVHVNLDVDAKPPIVLGPGTLAGIPYARGATVVYFGEKGTPIFTRTLAGPVRAVAAGIGPGGLRVAALLSDGAIVGLDARGRTVQTIRAQGVVSAIRVSSLGIAVQRGRMKRGLVIPYPKVWIGSRAVALPAGARMVDVAQGLVLWTRAGDLGTTSIQTGKRVVLANGTGAAPYFGQIEENGLAWAKKRVLSWRGGAVLDSARSQR
jgi:hypothetical protein